MVWTLVKNNCKLTLRNRIIIFLAIFGPVLIISALSNAFDDLLSNSYENTSFSVGYSVENTIEEAGFEQYLAELENQGVSCKKYSKDESKELVENGTVDAFVVIDKSDITLYSQDIDSATAKTCLYAINQYKQMKSLSQLKNGDNAVNTSVNINTSEVESPKMAEAVDYYGIIEIIYFIWLSIIFVAPVVQSERNNKIQARFVASSAGNIKLYLGKYIPCVALESISTIISIIICKYVFNIHWGNYGMTALILFLNILAASSFGMLCLYIVNNLGISVVILFAATWIAGYVGGSFETYMYSAWEDGIKELSPIYYTNRTLVEYSLNGSSDSTVGCIVYMLGITIVCGFLGILFMKRRMEEK